MLTRIERFAQTLDGWFEGGGKTTSGRTTPRRVVAAVGLSLLLVVGALACAADPEYDLLLVGGSVVDGTGAQARQQTVGVRDGTVVLLAAQERPSAGRVLDVTGQVVAPGFIDVHNHTEWAVLEAEARLNEGFVRQGVTTIVGGADGSVDDDGIERLIAGLEASGAGTNVAAYVGHNAVRRAVMEDGRDRPSDDQLVAMKDRVRRGMELGALGLSTGLMYEPGMWSETDEVVALAEVVAPFGGIYDSHVRDPVHRFVWSHSEAIEIGRRAGIPSKLGHLKSVALENEGKMAEVIARVQQSRSQGHRVVSDQYPYDGAATSRLLPVAPEPGAGVIVIPPELVSELGDPEAVRKALRDASLYDRFKEVSEQGVDGGFAWLKATGYTAMRFVATEEHPDLVGVYLVELAEAEGKEPFRALVDLVTRSSEPIHVTLGAIKEWEVQELMKQSWNMIASDGAYLTPDAEGGHPRGTGTFPRFLGHYVRELGIMELEEAIRRITSLPADVLNLEGRGVLEDGAVADIVVFDPETIIDRSTWTQPGLYAEGVEHVLLGGEPVLLDGEMTGAAPGRFVARGP